VFFSKQELNLKIECDLSKRNAHGGWNRDLLICNYKSLKYKKQCLCTIFSTFSILWLRNIHSSLLCALGLVSLSLKETCSAISWNVLWLEFQVLNNTTVQTSNLTHKYLLCSFGWLGFLWKYRINSAFLLKVWLQKVLNHVLISTFSIGKMSIRDWQSRGCQTPGKDIHLTVAAA
jgi:hypothetical protein